MESSNLRMSFNFAILLLLLDLLIGIFQSSSLGSKSIIQRLVQLPCASGQLNLWADRRLVMQIIESLPPHTKSQTTLKCPRRRPDIQQHIPEHLFLVFNGQLIQEVYNQILQSVHRPIPPLIEILRVKWRAGLEILTYNITITSLNKTLLFNPLLNIANYGYVPSMESDIKIRLPCTGKYSGFASFKLQVNIRRQYEGLRKIPHIAFEAQKYCLRQDKLSKLYIKCECKSRCNPLYRRQWPNEARKTCNIRCRQKYAQRAESLLGYPNRLLQ